MKIIFLTNGESPQFGAFKEGDMRDLEEDTASVLVSRGIAVPAEQPEAPKEKKKER